MKVFLDSNVVLDWLLDRPTGFPDAATQIIKACFEKKIEGYVSPSTIYLAEFVLDRASLTVSARKNHLRLCLDFLRVCPVNNEVFLDALDLTIKDLEDAFQLQISTQVPGLKIFITSNIKDFPKKHGGITVVHTKDFFAASAI
jgi:predicted nucleic acid-binding protein